MDGMMSCENCINYNHGLGTLACDFCDPMLGEDRFIMRRLPVKINLHGNPLPEKHGEWYDLCTAEDVSLHTGEMKIISLGINVKPPKGFHFLVASRSSTPLKWGLIIANGIGIIENTYCGDGDVLGLVAYATKAVTIPKGTRLAQMTLVCQGPEMDFEVVDTMAEADRGGYGSTGV